MPPMIATLTALAAGGAAGTAARFWAARALPAAPWGTLAVNLSGCFLIGLFEAGAARRGWGGPHARALLITGFCGAYTTFSTLILELDALLAVSPARGAAYVLVSVGAGLALFRAGVLLGRL
ncbi:MAG: CrcB family protein [Elusimicrobia bacterium]|nr:CrcB family protein [Elusimicrobiota bacterium]